MGRTHLERAAKQRCFLSGLQLIHCLHYFVGGVMGSSPDWDTLWPLAPGQREPHTNYLRVWHKTQQGISEDIPAIWGSSCTRKWKMPAYFLSKLWFCGTTAAKMSWWNVRASRAARNQQFSAPKQTGHMQLAEKWELSQVQQHHQDPCRRTVVLISLQL